MILDLTSDGKLSISQTKRMNEIEPLVRGEYDEYIGALGELNELKHIDWLLETSCRNTFASKLHERICKLALLQDLIDRNQYIDEVKVDDLYMKQVIMLLFLKNDYECLITVVSNGKLKYLIPLYNLIVTIYLCFNEWLWAKLIPTKKQPEGKIIAIENFLFLSSFDKNLNMIDRNYPGFFDHCSDDIKKNIWFLSVLNGIKHPIDWYHILRKINLTDSQILIKENYLVLKDYFIAIYQSIVIPRKIRQYPKWRNIDISSLIYDEVRDEIFSHSLVSSILYYRFFRRLRDTGIEIDLLIDWHENQTIDRALNIGMKQYFPLTKVKGYQGFVVSDVYSSLTPTIYERDNGLLPDEILVISNQLLENRKKYCSDFNISLAPAFRYMEAINHKQIKSGTKKIILVALPMLHREARQVLDLVLSAKFNDAYRILVKKHPTVIKQELLDEVPQARDSRLIFTEKKLTKLMDESTLFITMTSSAAIEAILCEVYVAIIANRRGITANPIGNIVDPNYWRLCYTPNCIDDALNYSMNNSILNASSYLVPLESETFNEFLKF